MLDRAISSHVAAQLHVSVQEAEGGEIARSLAGKVPAVLAPLAGGALCAGTDAAPPEALPLPPPDDATLFREQAEAIMTRGAGGWRRHPRPGRRCRLPQRPDVLCVRLFGTAEARIAQAARIENVDLATAGQRLPEVDRARAHYVRRLYATDIDDPDLYGLQIDSTALPPGACADLIATAYRALAGR